MGEYADRQQGLRDQLAQAQESLAGLPEDRRESVGDELRRLEETLGFAATVIDQTDPELVTDSAHSNLSGAFTQVTANTGVPTFDPKAHTEQVLSALAGLPADPREIEASKIKEAAANFQRSAQQRLKALQEEIDSSRAAAEEVGAQLEARRQEIAQLIEQTKTSLDEETSKRLTAIEASVTDLEANARNHVQRLDALVTEQQEAFRRAQDERAEEHREREKAFEARIEAVRQEAQDRTNTLIAEIEDMKARSAELVGAIGVTGTATRYGEEAKDQRKAADRWRLATVVLGVLAVVAAILAAFDHKAATIGAKIGIAILLGGVAAYTARQSARHRRREEHAKQLQLDLAAFPIFIEPLPEEDRVEETVRMVRRSFRGALSHPDEEDEPGPGALSQFVQGRRTKDEAA